MNALRFALNFSRDTSNDTARKCTNVSIIKDKIKKLAQSCYKNSVINNPDIQELVRTAVA